ncbi:unnamed protein product [Dibothriocephalus latus]|uniref:Major facilitator superfamily (MFS) profile domain-containing protein n=1 Tax=Dibothriocephalus latus TaxID=60516 RepID=A0A3P7MI23_DIBLA|nr:unnamed protein product [Dibothriocephalus latus]
MSVLQGSEKEFEEDASNDAPDDIQAEKDAQLEEYNQIESILQDLHPNKRRSLESLPFFLITGSEKDIEDDASDNSQAQKDAQLDEDHRIDGILHDLHPNKRRSLKSLPFFLVTMYFCCALLRFTFFLAQLTRQADDHFHDDATTARIAQTLSYALAGGILAGLLCGAVIDKLRAVFKPKISHLLTFERNGDIDKAILWLKLLPMSFSMLIMSTFAIIVSSLVFVAIEQVYYANFFFLVIMRGFLFSTFSSSMMAAFPVAQFGTLYGIGGAIAGAFSCLQYALLVPAPTIGNGIALGISILMFSPPIIIICKSLHIKKKALQDALPAKEKDDISVFM